MVKAKAGFSKYTEIVIGTSSIPKLLKDALGYLPSEKFLDNQFSFEEAKIKKEIRTKIINFV